jgi:hypothetical protein
MNNITMENNDVTPPAAPANSQEQKVNILDVPIVDETVALNMLVSFIHQAQKRGAFNLQESAKIWEAVQIFMKKSNSD